MKILTKEQELLVTSAIGVAEKGTSAEIKVHIDKHCKENPLDKAVETFFFLEMQKTAARNGVLIYLAYKDRKVAIIGDKGINELVDDSFWDSTYSIMKEEFVKGDICQGLCKAIENVGDKLKEFFPYQSDDVNELSDEISYGK
ncbi:MAG: TPM domain-containing protein [Rikenellaceae bacterium]